MFFDIHSHILPGIDDGATDLENSLALLEACRTQGVTDVILTPHFYPLVDILEEFKENTLNRFNELKAATKSKDTPNIYLGCEVLYYSGISKASSLEMLTLNGSRYILLEPDYSLLNKTFKNELLHFIENGFIPIIAHIERYYKARGYKDLLKFIKENSILTQVNATSLFGKHYNRVLKKLVKEDIISFIASDTHSLDLRPPMIKDAFDKIETLFGNDYKQKLFKNAQELYEKIAIKGNDI